MNRPTFFTRSWREILMTLGPSLVLIIVAITVAYKYANPAPPHHMVISTSDGEGDYQAYAKRYQDILKEDGVELEVRSSTGAIENLARLQDSKSDVEAGFVQDGLGSAEKAPDLSSLGSLYYEPIWVFYKGTAELTRFSQLAGKRVAIGRDGGGTRILSLRILKASGVDEKNAKLVNLGWQAASDALEKGQVDAAFFLATPEDPVVKTLVADRGLRLMSLDQAEAITRQIPFLHHLVLPHGALDLAHNIPAQDTHLVSPTATILVKDSLHPALAYLLLKALHQVHDDPGIFEKKNEFPTDKDYEFPLSDEAKQYYKSGTPFWQRYLPFWVATLVERFILVIFPLLALLLPMLKLIPRAMAWRVRSRIYQRYGELKFLETQIKPGTPREKYTEHLAKLDTIEERVNQMRVPLDFSDLVYVLREHIHFVRERLQRMLTQP
jgi:TRAP transporter TAXI family solute receptor